MNFKIRKIIPKEDFHELRRLVWDYSKDLTDKTVFERLDTSKMALSKKLSMKELREWRETIAENGATEATRELFKGTYPDCELSLVPEAWK